MSSPLRIEEIQGRGRSVIASQPLKSGQIILKDSPILLYSARPLILNTNHRYIYCSHCYRLLTSVPVPCQSCSVPFCTSNCRSEASTTSHTPWACQALLSLSNFPNWSGYPEEVQVQARFLVAAYNLAVVSPEEFRSLVSLQGERVEEKNDTGFVLHSVISSLCPVPVQGSTSFSLEMTKALLAKDKLNAFGLMEPFASAGGISHSPKQLLNPDMDGTGKQEPQRSVRAYGIYPNASAFNHDCLPNACRFDYIDLSPNASSSARGNTDIVIRMIHDVPEGREICLSYFPVNFSYRDRQIRLREDYGFVCSCDRCRVEADWSDDEDGDEVAMEEEGDNDDDLMEDEDEENEGGIEKENENENDFPHAYFFLRYMCDRENCWGTLAPLPTSLLSNGTLPSTMVMECNVCGNLKNDEEEVADRGACLS